MTTLLKALALGGLLASTAAAEPLFGVSTDVGVPDGAVASLVARPLPFVKAHAGIGYNAISTGFRAGATLSLPFWISPTASISYGRYPEGDANPIARRISGDQEMHSPMLEKVGYQFADGYLGLQFGRERVSFAIEAGYSRISGKIRNLDQMTGDMSESSTSVTIGEDPNVTVWSLSARIGLTVYVK